MKSNHIANAVLVACVVGLAAWWWWPANPPSARTPPVLVRSPQPAQAASPQPEVPDEAPPQEPVAPTIGPALLQALAQAIAQPQRLPNGLLTELPPGARMRLPIPSGRPKIAGQTIITEQPMPDGRISILRDKFEGYMEVGPPGEEEYQPVYSLREITTTADKAAEIMIQFDADAAQSLAP